MPVQFMTHPGLQTFDLRAHFDRVPLGEFRGLLHHVIGAQGLIVQSRLEASKPLGEFSNGVLVSRDILVVLARGGVVILDGRLLGIQTRVHGCDRPGALIQPGVLCGRVVPETVQTVAQRKDVAHLSLQQTRLREVLFDPRLALTLALHRRI